MFPAGIIPPVTMTLSRISILQALHVSYLSGKWSMLVCTLSSGSRSKEEVLTEGFKGSFPPSRTIPEGDAQPEECHLNGTWVDIQDLLHLHICHLNKQVMIASLRLNIDPFIPF